jgi:hypothetical protein
MNALGLAAMKATHLAKTGSIARNGVGTNIGERFPGVQGKALWRLLIFFCGDFRHNQRMDIASGYFS